MKAAIQNLLVNVRAASTRANTPTAIMRYPTDSIEDRSISEVIP